MVIYVLIQVLVLLLMFGFSVLGWFCRYYEFTEDSIILYKGVIFKTKKILTYNKINSIDIKRNLFDQIIGVAKLSIDSGATTTADMEEVVIIERYAKSTELQQHILSFVKKDSSTENEEDNVEEKENKEEVIYKYNFKNKLSFIIFNGLFELFILFIVTDIVLGILYIINDSHLVLSIFLFMAFLLLFTSIIGLIFITINHYNFRVTKDNDNIKVNYGLINKVNNTIPLSRVKAVVVSEGLIKRLFKKVTISLEVVGFGKSTNKVSNLVIPICKKSEVANYLDLLFNGAYKYNDITYNAKATKRKFFINFKFFVIFLFTTFTLLPVFLVGLLNNDVLIIPCVYLVILVLSYIILFLISFISKSNQGISFDDNQIVVSNGNIVKKKTIIRFENIISVQTVTTKRRKLAKISSYYIHFYNNAIKNVVRVYMLEEDLNILINKKIKY